MNQKLLFLGMIVLSIYGCNQNNEMRPIKELVGPYEFKMEKVGKNHEIDFVDRLQFKSVGIVYGEGISNISGTNQVLGYRYYFNGSYKIEDGVVNIIETDAFQIDDEDSFFSLKDNLIYKDGNQVWDQLLKKIITRSS
ncbi:hypothetical protein JYB62_03105 [Algoriphagus lutimaris]|uniref:hypothetical protein n=1 Tax=Algoriphagus lutimaris TaxID=613197 RepID=UPI00196B05A9|nr:hypothetical protein [Algoriphagus lutimaris]MBN3518978.1 hypothetical protein [Algoriphagus lutimaris]